MKYYLIKYVDSRVSASCFPYFPYLFKTKEAAKSYIYAMTFFPDEYVVVEALFED